MVISAGQLVELARAINSVVVREMIPVTVGGGKDNGEGRGRGGRKDSINQNGIVREGEIDLHGTFSSL